MRIAIIYVEPEITPLDRHWLARSRGAQELRRSAFEDSSVACAVADSEDLAACLESAGHEVILQPASDPAELCGVVARYQPDLIFNTCDSFAGCSALEMNLAALFELLGVPCVGTPARALGLAQNKALASAVLRHHGIATPAHALIEPGRDPAAACTLPFPLIVKPVAEDASIGIDDGAVVHNATALAKRVRFVWREFAQAALVERYIEGRELHVSLLAASPDEFTVLPIVEIDFADLPSGRPRILGYEAKWDSSAAFNQAGAIRCPAQLDDKTRERVGRSAVAAARRIGLRDYGRVDLRLQESDGAVFVLEVNPNPDLSSECTFAQSARVGGRDYGEVINEIVERAAERAYPRTRVRVREVAGAR